MKRTILLVLAVMFLVTILAVNTIRSNQTPTVQVPTQFPLARSMCAAPESLKYRASEILILKDMNDIADQIDSKKLSTIQGELLLEKLADQQKALTAPPLYANFQIENSLRLETAINPMAANDVGNAESSYKLSQELAIYSKAARREWDRIDAFCDWVTPIERFFSS